MMTPKIVEEGDHVRYTTQGVVMVGEFSRAVEATCKQCRYRDPLRLCADEPLDDAECDAILTSYLEGLGWDCTPDGDTCPSCSA